MSDNGPFYDWAAAAAAEIVNLTDPNQPKAERFGRILFVILEAMRSANAGPSRLEPSDN